MKSKLTRKWMSTLDDGKLFIDESNDVFLDDINELPPNVSEKIIYMRDYIRVAVRSL